MINRKSYEPLYVQIRKDIEEQILRGDIRIGDKLMSETEMLKYYKVGRMTIRTALSSLVASGCLRKERGVGTFCESMPYKKTPRNVHVLLNMKGTEFVSYFLSGIWRVLNANELNLVLLNTENSMENMARFLENILATGTDGVIMQPYMGVDPVTEECEQAILKVLEAEIPFLTIDGKFKNIDTACIMNDDNYGGEIATRHVISMGHKKILGLFRHKYKDSWFRENGYRIAIEKAHLKADVIDADVVDFQEICEYIRENGITAVVCYNDYLAAKCYRKFTENGIKVPEDISVVGYDDTELSINSIPRITTVTHPKDYMGEMAAEKLLEIMEGTCPTTYRYVFSPSLIKRESVLNLNKKKIR